ncbi:hypothetical protein SAMN02745216_00210 [Desulfatibacillum alkenivorans DSM 16219]|uniref:Uncharacterized protein n=1 Tax=Desulfatibacillum alkenivorans DSM 16219 TaxID=1121393 RepID=A0A1M6CD61_9BACT|nr:hypothetical protein [Desulfatibacillum alkenivorans]SHI58823.1 hypothetical protein SAMN02745216_00210 [Desulfatibacillum alkenivorans DSM 16219]
MGSPGRTMFLVFEDASQKLNNYESGGLAEGSPPFDQVQGEENLVGGNFFGAAQAAPFDVSRNIL